MNEVKARYISLTVIAAEAILLFLLYCLVVLNTSISHLSLQGAELPFDMIVSLLVFLCIGTLIVLSAFNEVPYHILSILEVAFIVLLMTSSSFHILLIVFYMVVLAPLIFYYAIRVWNR